jgi:hypothetical protein
LELPPPFSLSKEVTSLKEKLAKLIDVKSLMTLALTAGFIGLTCAGEITGEQFLTIFTMVVGFYFGTQAEKRR